MEPSSSATMMTDETIVPIDIGSRAWHKDTIRPAVYPYASARQGIGARALSFSVRIRRTQNWVHQPFAYLPCESQGGTCRWHKDTAGLMLSLCQARGPMSMGTSRKGAPARYRRPSSPRASGRTGRSPCTCGHAWIGHRDAMQRVKEGRGHRVSRPSTTCRRRLFDFSFSLSTSFSSGVEGRETSTGFVPCTCEGIGGLAIGGGD